MVVRFYSFSKKENSTKRPTGGTDFNCVLKSDSGVVSPVIELRMALAENPTTYNYAYIPDYDRYYFVSDWLWNGGLWIGTLDIDVLASWRDTIGASTLYVLRSQSNYDLNVVDTCYPAKIGSYYMHTNRKSELWTASPNLTHGTYIVGTINNDSSAAGAVVYYALTGEQMARFRAYMLSGIKAWNEITDFSGDIAKAFIDPFQYVVSCQWFPFGITGSDATLKFGFWDSGISASKLVSTIWTDRFTLARPQRTDTIRGNWQYIEPFAKYYLVYFPWGVIEIDGTAIGATGITCDVEVDLITGVAILNIYAGATLAGTFGNLMKTQSAQVGVQMQLAQIANDYSGLASAGGGGLSGLLNSAGGAIAGAIDSLFSGADIASSAMAGLAHASTSGSTGGFSAVTLGSETAFVALFYMPVEENIAENGRPLCSNVQISTLSGYIQVMDGDVSLASTKQEAQKVREYLEGGFYYE